MPEDFGIPPDVLAQLQAAEHVVRPIMESLQAIQPVIKNWQAAADLLAVQRSAMENVIRIVPSENPIRFMLPSLAVRQAIFGLASQFQDQQTLAAELAVREPAIEQRLLDLLPQTPEETGQVEQVANEVRVNPELSEKLRDAVNQVSWSGVARKVPLWVALYIAYRLLMNAANLPVTENLSSAQNAALQNRLVVLGIVVSIAAIILSRRD
jgi:hypothetical protein